MWTEKQAAAFVREVRTEAGDAWNWFVPRIRRALIHDKALRIVRQHHLRMVTVKDVDALVERMDLIAGTQEE